MTRRFTSFISGCNLSCMSLKVARLYTKTATQVWSLSCASKAPLMMRLELASNWGFGPRRLPQQRNAGLACFNRRVSTTYRSYYAHRAYLLSTMIAATQKHAGSIQRTRLRKYRPRIITSSAQLEHISVPW